MTARTVDAGPVPLHVEDDGSGPATVLVHGIATGLPIWRELRTALAPEPRTIAYDRRAYGASGAPEPYTGTTVGEQADDLAALIESLDAAPATLCGHDLGALVCLDVLDRHRPLVAGAVLIEPAMLWLSPRGPDAMSELRAAVESGARDAGAAGAVDAFLEQLAGPETAALLGTDRLERAHADVRAFAADLAAIPSWTGGRRALRSIDAPTTVVRARRAPPIFRAVAAAIADLVPRAKLLDVDAGHFAQVQVPEELAGAIAAVR